MVAHYTLTVYQADDVTPWFEVSTDPAHPHPYLHPPGEYDQGEIDLLGGRALVGEIQVRVIDPQTGADQSERWLTARLGIPSGQDGAGHSALNGRRGLLTQSDGAVVLDGVVSGVRLSESFAGFYLSLRDVRERHRRVSLFSRTGTATVLPRGVLNGYGKLPNGDWLIPPTQPLPAVWHGSSGFFGQSGIFDLSGLWDGRPLDGSRTAKAPPFLVLTEAMRKVTSIAMVGDFVPMPVYRDVEVWWRRTSGDTSWKVIRNIRPRGTSPHPLLLNYARARVEGVDGEVDAIHSIGVAGGGLGAPPLDVPNNGESVEVLILYVGPPTEDYPFHYEGTAGELLRNLYRGDYSESPITTHVDEVALLSLTTPVRLRITEAPKADRSREWIEEVYKQLRAAPALDRSGRISPVTAALPDVSEVLVELTDDVCQPIPGWDHPATDAVTAVRITYPRDYRVPVEDDPLGVRSAGDGLASIDVTVERRAPEWVVDLMGEQVHEIDGFLFRALGIVGSAGTIDPASGDVTDEAGHLEATRAAREILDRWVFGGQVSFARVSRAARPDLRAGQWVIDRRSWRPNYRELKRGGSSLAQIMSVRALDRAWLAVSLVDAGPADQPLTAPTLGTPTAADDGVVTVPVTIVPTGGEAAIYYAVAASAPAWGSGAWRLAGRIDQAGDVHTPPQPAGARVWITARGEGLGRRPSDITTPVSVTIPIVPRLHEVRIVLDGGTPTVHWQRNNVAQGVRIAYWIHPPESDPTGPATTVDVAASELGRTLGVTVQPGQAITVEVTPYTGWTGSAVSGTPGPSVERSVARPREPVQALPPTASITYVSADPNVVRLHYNGTVGPGGSGPLAYRVRKVAAFVPGPWGPGSGAGWAALPSGGVTEDVPKPAQFTTMVELEVRDAGGLVGRDAYDVPPRLPGLDGGLVDPGQHYSDGNGTPGETRDRVQLMRLDGHATAEFGASDGATVKLVSKGARSVTLANGETATFADSYQNPPLVIPGPGATMEQRDRWGTINEADADEGKGIGNDPAPTNALIKQAFGADVSATQITARLRLVATGDPVAKSASFAAPTSVGVGDVTGNATPADADVPAIGDRFKAKFAVFANNAGDEGPIRWTVALEVSLDNAAFAEVGAKSVIYNVDSAETAVKVDDEIEATVSGVDGGNDRFRLRLKSALGPPGVTNFALSVDPGALTWSSDANALYASATPNGDQDAVTFFIIAQG